VLADLLTGRFGFDSRLHRLQRGEESLLIRRRPAQLGQQLAGLGNQVALLGVLTVIEHPPVLHCRRIIGCDVVNQRRNLLSLPQKLSIRGLRPDRKQPAQQREQSNIENRFQHPLKS
jgi:hypothetical protein